MKRNQTSLLSLALVLLLAIFGGSQLFNSEAPAALPVEPVATVAAMAKEEPIIQPEDIAAYLFQHGELPNNFITKKEAQALGWDSSKNYLSDVAPGKSIGGDHYGNYEKRLPTKQGRTWKECDCNYVEGKRNAYRICFSNDGLVFYSDDHYQSFTEMKP